MAPKLPTAVTIPAHQRAEYVSGIELEAQVAAQTQSPPSTVQQSPNTDEQNSHTFPDGGREATLALLGSTCIGFASCALLNCPGSLQAWMSENQLSDISIAKLGWIFGFYAFMSFFAGIQIGPIFDAYGPRVLVCIGAVLLLATYFLLAICQTYWQFFLTLGLLGGIGTSMLITCAIGTVQQWYFKYRGIATAVALCGGSISGVIFPLTLEKLLPRIGFAWTLRAIGFLMIPFLIIGCLLIRPRSSLRPRKPSFRSLIFDPRILFAPDIFFTTVAVYCLEWGLFVVLSYISSYALHEEMTFELSYQLLAYVNAGSLVGRLLSGYIGDKIGRFNTQVVALLACSISILVLWTLVRKNESTLIAFAVLFGISSGSTLSLTPVCVSQLCRVERYGRTYTAVYTISSIGAMTGIPLAGEILESTHGNYWSLIVFAGLAYVIALISIAVVRVMKTDWVIVAKY